MSEKWSKSESSTSTQIDEIKKISKMIADIKFGMFTTVSEDGSLHSRPMAAQEIDKDNCVWFLTSKDSGKVEAIAHDKQVNIAFGLPAKNDFLSLAGRAEVLVDKAKIKELWNPFYLAWFPKGVEDPDICLIKVEIASAEYWDSPNSKVVQVVGLAKAVLTGQQYKASHSEHARVKLN